ncbi:MAG TPA: hypothetical protein VFU15_10065, partial [Bacteroidia bacterium]|nr:hypothetical protein [Bacteroidia bacterium]
MKKTLRSILLAVPASLLLLPSTVNAQCSGGTLAGNIVPTTTIQTVTVPSGGSYFTFTGVAGATYMFSFCASEGGSASFDTQLTILDDATGNYAGGYNDDWCGLQSYLTWACPSNAVYRVLASQYYCTTNATSATMAYKIMPPPNDDCVNATYIGVPSTVVGNTIYANPDVAPTCTTSDAAGGGVWYEVMGDGNQMTASLCGSSFDTRLRIFSGSCGALVCEGGNDDFCATQSQVTWCSVNGTLYYILVHGNGAATGDFTLAMSEVYVQPPFVNPSVTAFCGSGTVTINASGSTVYNWSPAIGLDTTGGPTVVATPPSTTTYTVAITDAVTGCPAYNTAQVIINPIPVVTASASSTLICGGGSSTLTGGGASSYTWMPGNLTGTSVTVTPTVTTTYTVTGVDGNGCSDTASVTVNVYPIPPVASTSAPASICIGDFATLSASGANTYSWMPGNLTGQNVNVAPTTTTTYTVTGTDGNGCTATSNYTLVVHPLPAITATAAQYTICEGSPSSLMGSGGVSYVWSDNSTANPDTTYPNLTTTYTVTGTDTNGCSNTDTVMVNVLWAPPVSATASVPTICSSGGSVLTASGSQSYTWMPGSMTGSSITVTPSSTTTYTVTGMNS